MGGSPHLILKAVVLRVTWSGVGTAVPHRPVIAPFAWPRVGDESYFLLEGDQDHLGADAACLGNLVDDGRCRLVVRAHVGVGAICIGRTADRRLFEVLQADDRIVRATAQFGMAGWHLGIEEALDLGNAHGVFVVELLVADDKGRVKQLARYPGARWRRGSGERGRREDRDQCYREPTGDAVFHETSTLAGAETTRPSSLRYVSTTV